MAIILTKLTIIGLVIIGTIILGGLFIAFALIMIIKALARSRK